MRKINKTEFSCKTRNLLRLHIIGLKVYKQMSLLKKVFDVLKKRLFLYKFYSYLQVFLCALFFHKTMFIFVCVPLGVVSALLNKISKNVLIYLFVKIMTRINTFINLSFFYFDCLSMRHYVLSISF